MEMMELEAGREGQVGTLPTLLHTAYPSSIPLKRKAAIPTISPAHL